MVRLAKVRRSARAVLTGHVRRRHIVANSDGRVTEYDLSAS